MKNLNRINSNFVAVFVLFSILSMVIIQITKADSSEDKVSFSSYVDSKGMIKLPGDFRLHMQHVGSWFVEQGDASGFHDVFTEASTIEYYREHKKFPDGATLVKELRANESGDYTTGANVKYSSEGIKQWFVMIKDVKGRFPGNPSWGDGWGWALIKPNTDLHNVSKNYKSDCIGCHIPAKTKDWIYTEAYPVLQGDHDYNLM